MFRTFALICVMAFPPSTPVFAQQQSYPSISGRIPIEIQNDWTYRSDDRANQNNDLFTTTEPEATVQISRSWSIFAHAVLEPVTPPDQFEARVFGDHGLFMEDLFVEYANGPFGVRAGKLNVGFGVGWDKAPGVYGTDFAEDGYETSERIGIIGSYELNAGPGGTHTLSAGSFFQDTTFLSQSTLRGRGDTRKEDGGVSNTENFGSFVVEIDGGGIAGLGDLGYHIAYMHQARGTGDPENEDSAAVALFARLDLGRGVTLSPLVEYVYQDNPSGAADETRDFLTLAAQAEWMNVNLALAWTRRNTRNAADDEDFQFQVSAGYAFDFGLSVDVGWKIAEEAGIETETVGALATYTIEF